MYIPIGVDCGVATALRKYGVRTWAFPFDWTVTYNGVSACVADNFRRFLPTSRERINDYDVFFMHDFLDAACDSDKEKYLRRISRFQEILATTDEEVVFIRRGHGNHQHLEHEGRYMDIKSDIVDARDLAAVLREQYPRLNFRIVVILVCGRCFSAVQEYKSGLANVEIHNIVSLEADTEAFEECVRRIVGA
jgi:hypothetical protein